MNFSFLIAFRYLFSKKSTNAINLITFVSILGIAIGTTALVLILSVFNGFESLMKNYLDDFNPDLKIESRTGKFFATSSVPLDAIYKIPGIVASSIVLEEVALLEYGTKQQVAIVKGVDQRYLDVNSINEAIKDGNIDLDKKNDTYSAIAGRGIQHNLNISLENIFTPLKIFVPNRNKRGALDRDFKSRSLTVSGVFSIQNERDNQYIITSYDFIAPLLEMEGSASAIEIKVHSGHADKIKDAIDKLIGKDFVVQNRYQQDESFLKIMNIEKWSSYFIFAFTLLLITFNVVGCLWMIVLDKKKDLSILQAMGTSKRRIQNIFIIEGCLIGLVGFTAGFFIASILYILQKNVGIITVPEGFSISSYPIEMETLDVVIVFCTVLVLGILAALPASRRAAQISAFVHVE